MGCSRAGAGRNGAKTVCQRKHTARWSRSSLLPQRTAPGAHQHDVETRLEGLVVVSFHAQLVPEGEWRALQEGPWFGARSRLCAGTPAPHATAAQASPPGSAHTSAACRPRQHHRRRQRQPRRQPRRQPNFAACALADEGPCFLCSHIRQDLQTGGPPAGKQGCVQGCVQVWRGRRAQGMLVCAGLRGGVGCVSHSPPPPPPKKKKK